MEKAIDFLRHIYRDSRNLLQGADLRLLQLFNGLEIFHQSLTAAGSHTVDFIQYRMHLCLASK